MTNLTIIFIAVVTLLVIQLSIMYYFWKKRSTMRAKGESLEDEVTKMVKHEAGYNTYWTSWWMWLSIFVLDTFGVFTSSGAIRVNWVIWLGIMVMKGIYTINHFLINRKLKIQDGNENVIS
ncbi:MAG: hypothetical protein GPJ54_22145 [Candidatus Heimdallarchaeota archaeon]|nr:hypothetical protein [Candidatus Heimdallarchaeota archaeon]